jgi:hypothetical protein
VTCLVHDNNVRVVDAAPRINLADLTLRGDVAIYDWVYDALLQSFRTFGDGIVFDYEETFMDGSREATLCVALVNTTRQIFQKYNPTDFSEIQPKVIKYSPIKTMKDGIDRYITTTGVDRNKIVVGVPWYGYKYPCPTMVSMTDRYCQLDYQPFRDVRCSDAISHRKGN